MRQYRTISGAWLLVAVAALTFALAAAFSLAGAGYCSSATKGRAAGAGAGGRVGGAAGGGSSIGGGRVAAPSAAAAPLTSCLAAAAAADSSRSSSNGSGRRRRGTASRREAWQERARSVGLWSLALGLAPAVARAADAAPADAAAAAGPRRWISGKGEKPKGSKDRTGTKRDSSYLRCLSDCATDCRKPGQGLSRDSEDCLELCQDYCCQTYEQCTYLLQPE